jgi:hypothetical protein
MIEEKCVVCGRIFQKKKMAHGLKHCPECNEKRKKDLYEKRKKHMRSVYIPKAKSDQYVCKKVNSCIYRGKMGSTPICNYLCITGRKRPCDVEGCTEYKRGKALSEKIKD